MFWTIVARNNVKKVKLVINPVTTPSGRFLPPVSVPDNTMGRIGSMQGESMVTIPPRKAKNKRIIMLQCVFYYLSQSATIPFFN